MRSQTSLNRLTRVRENSISKPSSELPNTHTDDRLSSALAFNDRSSIARYLPSEQMAFLVEDRRLTGSERVSQKVSSVLPWILLGIFASSPFFVMKYNLERISSDREVVNQEATSSKQMKRPIVTRLQFNDIPDILQRRTPSVIYMYDESFHSRVLLLLFRELDRLLSQHNIDIGICVIPHSSSTPAFRKSYPVGSICQYVDPANGSSVVDFEGPWNARDLLEFMIPPSQITPAMNVALNRIESKLGEFRQCLFRRKFINKDIQWLTEHSLDAVSVEDALVRCETMK